MLLAMMYQPFQVYISHIITTGRASMAQHSDSKFHISLGRPGEKPASIFPIDLTASSTTWSLPQKIGSGLFMTESLPSGLTMTLSSCKLKHGLHARLLPKTDCITLVFNISGRSVNKNSFFRQGFEVEPGFNCLYWFPDPELVREASKGENIEALVLNIPKNTLVESGPNTVDSPDLQEELHELFGREDKYCFHKNVNSHAMSVVLEHIVNCRFQGRSRRLFLEAKALELLALKLDLISGTPKPAKGMSEQQMQGVLAARDLLLKDLRQPPSIHDLARTAGMSHPRLGKHFKSVFGCSPFELLRRKRLEWSLDMVRENTMSLTEIAYSAGYANSSHFSTAFLKYYGMQPSQYRKEKAGNLFYSIPHSKR